MLIMTAARGILCRLMPFHGIDLMSQSRNLFAVRIGGQ